MASVWSKLALAQPCSGELRAERVSGPTRPELTLPQSRAPGVKISWGPWSHSHSHGLLSRRRSWGCLYVGEAEWLEPEMRFETRYVPLSTAMN
ncbi:hypothetical protein ColTof3_00275 [Colletotrichum tofieldiae]|nr:hypothetical protein ColTof3_00275 [Colletotrichum tofieldiae]GKT88795.1 hypothetical protein Ct61P_06645 [Colletotrichum tofieldiae]